MSKRDEVLKTAQGMVSGERDVQYGDPLRNFKLVAELWTIYISRVGLHSKITIDAHNVAVMLALLKIARIQTGQTKDDNYIDACGYLALAAEMKERLG